MMETTPRHGLPLLIAGQIQKELFHNEALTLLDLLVNASVEGVPIAVPPTTPVPGAIYRVAAAASGSFAGHAGSLAAYSAGGWRFVAPVEGMRLTERTTGVELAYRGGVWTSGQLRTNEITIDGLRVVGARGSSISDTVGGALIDAEVRAAVAQILTALRTHGLIAT